MIRSTFWWTGRKREPGILVGGCDQCDTAGASQGWAAGAGRLGKAPLPGSAAVSPWRRGQPLHARVGGYVAARNSSVRKLLKYHLSGKCLKDGADGGQRGVNTTRCKRKTNVGLAGLTRDQVRKPSHPTHSRFKTVS